MSVLRVIPASLKARLPNITINVRVDLFTVTLADGVTVYRWTTAETPITVSGNTFLPAGPSAPGVKRSLYNNAFWPAVDTLDLTLYGGAFTIGGKRLAELARRQYFSGARVQVDHLMGQDLATALSDGPILSLFEGKVGQCEPQGGTSVVLHCSTDALDLQQTRPFIVIQPACNYAVYDTNCGLSRAAFTLSGAVSGVPTTKTIPTASAPLTAKAAGYFDLGFVTFTSGALIGTDADIDTWSGTTFSLVNALDVAPAVGDTFDVCPGCHLTLADCGGKFSNTGPTGHWRGYSHIPSSDAGA